MNESSHLANIFDPIQQELDQSVFKGENPRPSVVAFIKNKFYDKFKELVLNPEAYFHLVLTGSLTTYQYSDTSDCDISVLPDYQGLTQALHLPPNEVRRLCVRLATNKLDGTFVPGTQHPLQYFVVADDVDVSQLYAGKSGWSFWDRSWISPPDKARAHDVVSELPELYQRAQAIADKMKILLDGGAADQNAAKELFGLVHAKRNLDEQNGLGDFSEGNVVYKYLLHQGYFDKLRGLGVRIAWNPFKKKDELNSPVVPDEYRTPEEETGRRGLPYTDTYDPNETMRWSYHPDFGGLAVWPAAKGYHFNWQLESGYGKNTEGYAGGTISPYATVVDEYHSGDNNQAMAQEGIDAVRQFVHPYEIGEVRNGYSHALGSVQSSNHSRRVVYNFNQDHLILANEDFDDHVVDADHVILGNYDGENVHLHSGSKQWLNANYFKRLWLTSFPEFSLKNVMINGEDVPTRDKNHMTYTEKNPAIVSNPEIFKHAKDPWRKGKDWKDFIKNKKTIVEFQIGDTKDESFEGRVLDIAKDHIRVEVAPGEDRTLSDELLKQMKFRVRDDKTRLGANPWIGTKWENQWTEEDEKAANYEDETLWPENEWHDEEEFIDYLCAFVYLGPPKNELLMNGWTSEHGELIDEYINNSGEDYDDAWVSVMSAPTIAGHVGRSITSSGTGSRYIFVIYSGALGTGNLELTLKKAAWQQLVKTFPGISEANEAEYANDWYGYGM